MKDQQATYNKIVFFSFLFILMSGTIKGVKKIVYMTTSVADYMILYVLFDMCKLAKGLERFPADIQPVALDLPRRFYLYTGQRFDKTRN